MKSPFKFLDSYTRDDREIFFGRDREIEELYHKVFESKIMLVYGVSGTGKSSLIHCGLANKFQESDRLPLNIRRGSNILESLSNALRTTAITPIDGETRTPAQFRKAVRSLYFDYYKPIYFIFDQFEELFIFGTQEEKNGLVQVIKSLATSDLQCRFIFVLREEYLATVSLFEKSIPGFFSNRIRIEKMNRENAAMAIEGPCRVSEIKTDEGFPLAVLDKLCPGDSEVELTYLQVYLDRIFRLAVENSSGGNDIQFPVSLIDKAGNVTDVLGDFLDEQVALQKEPELALGVLKAFVSVKGTRQAMTREEVADFILSIGRHVPEDVLTELLQVFVNLRILHEKDQHGKYELRHDALAAKIFDKFTLGEKELLEVRKFIENAYFNHETRGIYPGKDDLDYLGNYIGKLILPKDLDEFVKISKSRLQAQKRALTILTRISALLIIAMVGGIAQYYMNTQENTKNKDLINMAVIESQISPIKSLSTSFSVWNNDSTSVILQFVILNDIRKILNDTADNQYLKSYREKYMPFSCGSGIIKANISESGRYIFGWLKDSSVFAWETGNRRFSRFLTGKSILNVKFNEKDQNIAVIYSDETCVVYDLNGKEKFTIKTTPNSIMNERLICFFPEGRFYLAGITDDRAIIYDSAGNNLFTLEGHKGRINSLDISPDGRFVATASCDKKVFIWNYNHQTQCFSPYDTLTGHSDTVWSCEFNNSGLYILTASSDTTTRIWDLDGNEINPDLYFGARYQSTYRTKTDKISTDQDRLNPALKYYYSKACDASFNGNDRVITATTYENKNYMLTEYCQVMYYSNQTLILKLSDPMLQILSPVSDTLLTVKLSRAIASPDFSIAAISSKNSNQVSLVSPQGFNILILPGGNPMFSEDKCTFYWIENETIFSLPVNPGEIKKSIEKTGVLEGTRYSSEIWTVI
jgi:hypothetical protein